MALTVALSADHLPAMATARDFVRTLLMTLDRKNCWQLAEARRSCAAVKDTAAAAQGGV